MEVKKQRNVVVSKDTAIFLREHGHIEYCDCYLHTDNDSQDDYEMWSRNQHSNLDLPDSAERIAAPYVFDALMWLNQNGFVTSFDIAPTLDKSWDVKLWSVKLYHNDKPACAMHEDVQEALYRALDVLVSATWFKRASKNG